MESNPDKHYNWFMGADMYLATSALLCKIILRFNTASIDDPTINSQELDEEAGFTSANPDYEMIMPIVFNLKHGIELYLKALIMTTGSLEYPHGHDLISLLNDLISKILNNFGNSHLPEDILRLLDNDVRKIIEKYYYGLYAFSKYRNNPDIYNEAEKYPEYRNANCYEVRDCFEKIKVSHIEMIKNDCIKLQDILHEKISKGLYELKEDERKNIEK